jgi:hypothetical protein
MPAKLDVAVTPDAREIAQRMLAQAAVERPTLCLLKVRLLDGDDPHWSWGVYGPKNIRGLRIHCALAGHRLMHDVDGMKVAIPQFQLLRELRGKVLGRAGKRLVVIPRSSRG